MCLGNHIPDLLSISQAHVTLPYKEMKRLANQCQSQAGLWLLQPDFTNKVIAKNVNRTQMMDHFLIAIQSRWQLIATRSWLCVIPVGCQTWVLGTLQEDGTDHVWPNPWWRWRWHLSLVAFVKKSIFETAGIQFELHSATDNYGRKETFICWTCNYVYVPTSFIASKKISPRSRHLIAKLYSSGSLHYLT
jgi:hypothetical protein